MKTIFPVQVLKNNKYYDSTINLISNEKNIAINFEINDIKLSYESESPFFALAQLRKALEKVDTFLLCNGARRDVYPSGMAMRSIMAYELKMGRPAKKLINIFDPAKDINKIGTVDDQKKYRDIWLESISKKNK